MIKGGLFTRYFLEDGIRQTAEYQALTSAEIASFSQAAHAHWQNLAAMAKVNEAETEPEFILPVLDTLGWSNLPQQKTGKDGKDVPDALLFTSAERKDQARRLPPMQRFPLGAIIVADVDSRLLRSPGRRQPAGQNRRIAFRLTRQMRPVKLSLNDSMGV